MKKLPEIYKNNIKKNINNNKKACLVNCKEDVVIPKKTNIKETIEEIFNGLGYSYNIPVLIETKIKKYNTSLITKTNKNIVTIDNDIIPIKDIINLQIINNKE